MYNRFKKSVLGVAFTATATAAVSSLTAGDPGKAVINDKVPIESWSFCDIFDNNTLYKGEGFVKKLQFTGRYHGNFIDSDNEFAPIPGSDSGWDHRRFRAGFKANLANDLTFQNIYNLDTTPTFNGDSFVANIDELFIQWDPSEDVYITVGKQKQKILSEYRNSSNSLFVFERSILTQNVLSQKLWGGALGFKAAGLSHEVGIWGAAFENDFAWPSFENAGPSLTYRANYEVDDSTTLFFDYQFVDQNTTTSEIFAGSPYENVFAVGSESKWGNFGLQTDLVYAANRGGANVLTGDDSHGFLITPYYDITDKLQLVARYSYLSDGQIGRPQQFAQRQANGGRYRPYVDGLSTLFVGVNYYICGTKLRVQGGYEWAVADNVVNNANREYENGSWLLGVRTHW